MNASEDCGQNTYPKILVPAILIGDNYKAVLNELPDEPVLPVKKTVKDERKASLSFSVILAIVIFIFALNQPDFFGTGMIFITILLIYKFLSSSAQTYEYNSSLQKENEAFSAALVKYQDALQSYKPILDLKNALPKYLEEEKEMEKILIIRDLCKIKKTFIEDDNSIKVGYSENKFLYFLNNQFGERIKTKKKVSNDFEAYFPDFIYYDNVRQIYLDIEIDEPYDLLEGKPIHCLFDDSRRDVFFIDHYWSVIRFSEKQIITSPDSCIKTIQSVITALEYGHDNWTIYIEKDDAWEEETAIKMEQEGFREKYLGIEKKTRSPKIETPFNSRVTRSFILSDEDLPF